jgi:hypothetical protein
MPKRQPSMARWWLDRPHYGARLPSQMPPTAGGAPIIVLPPPSATKRWLGRRLVLLLTSLGLFSGLRLILPSSSSAAGGETTIMIGRRQQQQRQPQGEAAVNKKKPALRDEEVYDKIQPQQQLYGNLSCPFEWSKFSCLHQGRLAQAERSQALVLETWRRQKLALLDPTTRPPLLPAARAPTPTTTEAATTPTRVVLPKKKKSLLLLVGDSTMRQVFVALGCFFWQRQEIRDYNVEWEQVSWPCHGTPHCIERGNHSGFNTGHFTTVFGTLSSSSSTNGAVDQQHHQQHQLQVFFVPIGGSSRYLQPDIVAKWNREWAATGHLTFSLQQTPQVYNLTNDDTIVYNIGLHVPNRTDIYRTFDEFGRNLLTRGPPQEHNDHHRPTLVYMNTITQHFPTPDGRFVEHLIHTMRLADPSNSCTANVATNPLLDTERSMIRAGVNADWILSPNDEELGLYHVGGIDCTHYCMPGPPDVFAHRLLQTLLNS